MDLHKNPLEIIGLLPVPFQNEKFSLVHELFNATLSKKPLPPPHTNSSTLHPLTAGLLSPPLPPIRREAFPAKIQPVSSLYPEISVGSRMAPKSLLDEGV